MAASVSRCHRDRPDETLTGTAGISVNTMMMLRMAPGLLRASAGLRASRDWKKRHGRMRICRVTRRRKDERKRANGRPRGVPVHAITPLKHARRRVSRENYDSPPWSNTRGSIGIRGWQLFVNTERYIPRRFFRIPTVDKNVADKASQNHKVQQVDARNPLVLLEEY